MDICVLVLFCFKKLVLFEVFIVILQLSDKNVLLSDVFLVAPYDENSVIAFQNSEISKIALIRSPMSNLIDLKLVSIQRI